MKCIGKLKDTLLLLEAHAALLATLLSALGFGFLPELLVLEVLAPLHLSLNCLLMLLSTITKSTMDGLLDKLLLVILLDHLKLNLVVEGRHEKGAHRIVFLASEQTNVAKLSKSISLEETQVLLRHDCCKLALLASLLYHLVHPLLKVASINFVVVTVLSGFDALRLDKHRLTLLLVLRIVLGEDSVLVAFDHLDTSLLE